MLYGIKCKKFFTVSANDLRSMGWGEEKWHKDTLPNFDGKMASLTREAVRSTALSCWSGHGVANEGFYTFSLNGNSCHFDTFLEQIYWIRERDQEPLYLGNAPGRPVSKLVYTSKHTYGKILIISCELGLTDGSRPNLRFVQSP